MKMKRARTICMILGFVFTMGLNACQVEEVASEPVEDVKVAQATLEITPSPENTAEILTEEVQETEKEGQNQSDIAEELPQAPQGDIGVQGYIEVPNTKMKYPIVIAEDNEYYLARNTEGQRDYRGSIFLDYRNAQPNERRNIILYGHNMKDQSMFSTIHKFGKKSFFNKNKDAFLEIYGVKYRYEVVLAGIYDYRIFNHIQTSFEDEKEFIDYYTQATKSSQNIRENYIPYPGDQMLTLSTCVSHSIKDYNYKRMVLIARMTEVIGAGENSDIPEGYGPIEAAEVFKKLPEIARLSIEEPRAKKEDKSDRLILPPGEAN